MSSMREAKPASARATTTAVASTVWKRGAGPQAGALDDLAQPTAARVHRLHRCLWLLITWSWIGVSSVAHRLGSRWIGVVGHLCMRVQIALHSHRVGSILLLQLLTPTSACYLNAQASLTIQRLGNRYPLPPWHSSTYGGDCHSRLSHVRCQQTLPSTTRCLW